MTKTIKKTILFLVLGLIVIIMLVLGLKAYIEQDTRHLTYSRIAEIPEATTAIVLGASVHSDGKLSPVLKDRVDSALELFRRGKVEYILVSGDHRSDDYNEVDAMGNYLLEKGVPEEAIILDHSGLDTYDTMYRAREVFQIESGIVVTQKFHLPRALFIAKNLGLKYNGLEAGSVNYRATNKIQRRELLANFKAVYEVIVQREARNLQL
ncbi:SanA/YdcF family protein [Salegentibacter sp. HM20]